MKAVVVHAFGPVETARFETVEAEMPGPGEVVIDMCAAEVNFPDILVMEGRYQVKPPLPFSPGKAGAGTVSAIGEGVEQLALGDKVAVQVEYGAYSATLKARADTCYKMPQGMPFKTAASLGLVFQTSHFALIERAGFKQGDNVLVLGASGGIGSASVQLAKAMGAKKVMGTVRGQKSVQIAREAGCDAVIDLEMGDIREGLRNAVHDLTDGQGADIVIDPVGGDVTGAALRAMAWRGRLVIVGFAAGTIPTIKANYLLVKNISVTGLQWSDYRERDPDRVRRVQMEIFALWSSGRLKPQIGALLPLSQFADALHLLKDGKAHGKIILTIGEQGS